MRKIVIISVLLLIMSIPVFAQSGYQMLEVDGIRVTIEEIRFTQGYSDSSTIGSIEVNQTVNLTDIPADVFFRINCSQAGVRG